MAVKNTTTAGAKAAQKKAGTAAAATKRKGKGKKKELKRANISTELIPIEEETWLLQPIAVTMMRHDYSLIQIRILVSVVESLQSILHGILNNQRGRQMEIFQTDELDEDGRMPIKLPFKELGVDPNHYPQLRNSLKMLASIPVEIPYKTQEGRKYTKATNLCDVYIPIDRSYNKYAILKIDREVAERLVSLDFGYHRLGKQIVFACKNRYTCRRVLDPARDELKELADKGFCDCYFDYKKQYDNGQRGGEPDELVFIIYKAKNAMNAQLAAMTEQQRKQFQSMLMKYFSFTPANAKKMADRIDADIYPDAMQKLMELRQRFLNDSSIRDRAAYTFKSLDKLLKDREVPNTIAEEIK